MMKTIETKDSETESQLKSRHHTQPRINGKQFDYMNDYIATEKHADVGPYISSVQPRIKSGGTNMYFGDNYSSMRKELQNKMYMKTNPTSLIDTGDSNKIIRTKRNTSGTSSTIGMSNPLSNAGNRFQLQGFTIRPDFKNDHNSK